MYRIHKLGQTPTRSSYISDVIELWYSNVQWIIQWDIFVRVNTHLIDKHHWKIIISFFTCLALTEPFISLCNVYTSELNKFKFFLFKGKKEGGGSICIFLWCVCIYTPLVLKVMGFSHHKIKMKIKFLLFNGYTWFIIKDLSTRPEHLISLRPVFFFFLFLIETMLPRFFLWSVF